MDIKVVEWNEPLPPWDDDRFMDYDTVLCEVDEYEETVMVAFIEDGIYHFLGEGGKGSTAYQKMFRIQNGSQG